MEKPLRVLQKLNTPKAYLLWIDPITQRWVREEITPAAYKKLATTPYPEKPSSFSGTQHEWEILWTTQKAKAIDGSPIERNTEYGDAYVKEDGSVMLFLGDIDNDGCLRMKKDDYTGLPSKMTVISEIPIVGMTIINGVIKT